MDKARFKIKGEQVAGVSGSPGYQGHRRTAGCPVVFAIDTRFILTPDDEV